MTSKDKKAAAFVPLGAGKSIPVEERMSPSELRAYARGLREGKATPSERCKRLEEAIERMAEPASEAVFSPYVQPWYYCTTDSPARFTMSTWASSNSLEDPPAGAVNVTT